MTTTTTAIDSIKLEDTLNKTWKNDKSGFGYRMLQKMGWKEEKGLGKNEDGISTSVKVSRREEGLGLGVTKDSAGNSGWSTTVTSFNAVLDLLNTTYGTKPPKTKKKTPSIQVRIKYGKMSAAKDLKSKSSKDLAAVLGQHPIPAISTHELLELNTKQKKRKNEEIETSTIGESVEESEKKSKKKKSKKSKTESLSSETISEEDEVNNNGKSSESDKKKKKKRKTDSE